MTRSENYTNQIAELSSSHSSWHEAADEVVSTITSHLCQSFFLLLYWIEKRSCRGHLLENLRSFGTKIIAREPNVSQYVWEDTEKQTTKVNDDFTGFFPNRNRVVVFMCCRFTTLAKYSRLT